MAISLDEVLTGAIEMLDGAEGTVHGSKEYNGWACDINPTKQFRYKPQIYLEIVQIMQDGYKNKTHTHKYL